MAQGRAQQVRWKQLGITQNIIDAMLERVRHEVRGHCRSSEAFPLSTSRSVWIETIPCHPLDFTGKVGGIFSPPKRWHRLACTKVVWKNSKLKPEFTETKKSVYCLRVARSSHFLADSKYIHWKENVQTGLNEGCSKCFNGTNSNPCSINFGRSRILRRGA